jgi:hypothetical protein
LAADRRDKVTRRGVVSQRLQRLCQFYAAANYLTREWRDVLTAETQRREAMLDDQSRWGFGL